MASDVRITPHDFYLRLYLKFIVYKTPVISLGELELIITGAIETVTPPMLRNATREIKRRSDNYVPGKA